MEQGELAGLVSRFVSLTANGKEKFGHCPFHDDTHGSLRVGEAWRCLECAQHEVFGADAVGFLMSWENCSRETAVRQIASGDLPEPKPIEQTALRRPALFGLKQVLERPDEKVWIHDRYEVVRAARDLIPERIHLGLIPGRSLDELGLPPERYCVLFPTNTEQAWGRILTLAGSLHAAGHKVRVIDPRDRDDNWTLLDAVHHNQTHDEIMTWAKTRYRAYPFVAPEPELPALAPANPLGQLPAGFPSAADVQQPALGATPALGDTKVAPPHEKIDSGPSTPSRRSKNKPDLAVVDKSGALRAPELDPDPDQLPAFSEFALARRFAGGLGQDWRYTAAWACWAKWDGMRWRQDERKLVTWEVKECCTAAMEEHLAGSTPAQRMKLTTFKTVNAVIGLACADPQLATGAEQWDADPWLLGTPSGIVDLKTGALTASGKHQLISKSTLVTPAEGKHPLFDMVIARPARGDADMLAFLWRWLGYLLTGDVREERFMFLHGVGGSGKGTLIKVIADILGDYGRAIAIQAFTESQHQRHSQEIAKLQGARFVYASETEEGSRFDEAMLKWLTGRDKITAHKMRQDDVEFYPQFKLLIYGNNRPSLKSVGEDMRRRIDLIEFPGTIPEEERDTTLKDRLREEYPAILASMIRACVDWHQRGGLGKPETVSLATENYLRANDVLGDFIEDCLDLAQDSYSASGEVYKRFQSYCSERGERYIMAQRTFSQRMESRGYALGKIGGARIIRGVKVRYADTDPRERAGWMPDE